MYFTGQDGCVRVKRRHSENFLTDIDPADIDTRVNRFAFDRSELNLITGDRLYIETEDPRGINWIPVNAFYVNVNFDGGIRAYKTFEAAVSNDRSKEYVVTPFSGGPMEVRIRVIDFAFDPLASVTSFTFDTDRAALDATAIGDAYNVPIGQGLISGSGTIDCIFDYRRQLNCPVVTSGELPILLLQTIYRMDLGSEFAAALQLAPETKDSLPVYYEVQAVATRTGVVVDREGLIRCSIDFVSTGDFRLIIGSPGDLILTEFGEPLAKDQDLDLLLQALED